MLRGRLCGDSSRWPQGGSGCGGCGVLVKVLVRVWVRGGGDTGPAAVTPFVIFGALWCAVRVVGDAVGGGGGAGGIVLGGVVVWALVSVQGRVLALGPVPGSGEPHCRGVMGPVVVGGCAQCPAAVLGLPVWGSEGLQQPGDQTPLTTVAGQPPQGRPPTSPAARSPHRACRPRDSVGPSHPHTRTHSTWVADPDSPPSGRAVEGGGAPDLRRPSQRRKAPPPGTRFCNPHSEQRPPARAHAVGPVLGPEARTDRSRDTRVAEPRLPAPEDGRPGEGQRLTPDAPHNGGRPPPPGTAPHHPRGTQPPQGVQAKGTVLGPHTRTPAPTPLGRGP